MGIRKMRMEIIVAMVVRRREAGGRRGKEPLFSGF